MAEETATFSSSVSQFPCTLQTRDVTGCESSLVSHPLSLLLLAARTTK